VFVRSILIVNQSCNLGLLCYKFFTPGKQFFNDRLAKSQRQFQKEVNLGNTLKARENPVKHLHHDFVFSVDWLRRQHFFSD